MSVERRGPQVGFLTGADLRRGAPGGVHAYVLGLSRFLVARGVGVRLLSNGPVDDAPSSSTVRPVTERYVPGTVGFHRALRRWPGTRDLAALDLLHLHRPDDLWPLLRVPSLPPAICTLHGDPSRGIRRRRGRAIGMAYLRIERRTLPRFRAIIAVDDRTAESYRRRYPSIADRIRSIPLAVDSSSRHRSTRPAPDSPPSFLFVGRLSVEKRIDSIVRAMKDPSLAGAKLLVAGSGPEESRLRKIAVGLGVSFLGNVDRESLRAHYEAADALVLASEFEGLPTVALEALACGCPVVAPCGCGLDAILGDGTGVLLSDISALPKGMMAAARLRRSGQPIGVPDALTWPSVGARILDLYREVVPEAFS